jgi:hypothetical protein
MTPGWRLVCYIVAIVLFLWQAWVAEGDPVKKYIAPGWVGLAFFALPLAWDAGSL